MVVTRAERHDMVALNQLRERSNDQAARLSLHGLLLLTLMAACTNPGKPRDCTTDTREGDNVEWRKLGQPFGDWDAKSCA